ncbi:RHS repeat-associated core domain-containing protein [Prevotella sp. 10(H)]|uniref:RHS repeat-associated core domain-containing protein n=1 Tax=Prevotella sp. 10(H) TaxID=1158294 RepID=UPI0004A71D58|nr:RHS repeat-associated core domain-containing protein [Prevotella sp. 10(H)]
MLYAVSTGTDIQSYKYNGKKLDQNHQLNMYDYSAKFYEPGIGRFSTVDPLAEKYYSWSPYAYVGNNPLKYIDPTGMDWWSTNNPEEIEKVLLALKSGESIDSQEFGDKWTRIESVSENDYAIFDDESSDFSIDGKSWKDFQGFGAKEGIGLGTGLMSLGTAAIWGNYMSDMELANSGKFRLGSKAYNLAYMGGRSHSGTLVKNAKATFMSGVKLGGYAKAGSSVLSWISVGTNAYSLYSAIDSQDAAATFKSSIDGVMTGVGFAGPVGAGISAYWFLTEPGREKWRTHALMPYTEITGGIVYPTFLGPF